MSTENEITASIQRSSNDSPLARKIVVTTAKRSIDRRQMTRGRGKAQRRREPRADSTGDQSKTQPWQSPRGSAVVQKPERSGRERSAHQRLPSVSHLSECLHRPTLFPLSSRRGNDIDQLLMAGAHLPAIINQRTEFPI
jgi:hypothetical protein